MYRSIFDQETKLWSGLPYTFPYAKEVSVGMVLMESLERFPNKIGQINDNNGFVQTNAEIRTKSLLVAQNLIKLGYEHDNIIGICCRNHHHLTPVILGALIVGAPLNTIDPSFTKNEVMHMFSVTRPSAVFCEEKNVKILQESLKEIDLDIPIYLMDANIPGTHNVEELFSENGADPYFSPPAIADNSKHIAFIPCSSGSTGFSKGVCISHAAILQTNNYVLLNGEDVLLTFGTFYWLTSIQYFFLTTLHNSLRILTTDIYSPELLFKIIQKYKITRLFTPPSSLALALVHPDIKKYDLSSVKSYHVGGSKVSSHLCSEMNKILPNGMVSICYGCTEASNAVTSNYPNFTTDSVGLLIPGAQLKIIDETDNKCGIGEKGEICIKLNNMFLTYYGNKTAKKESIDNEGFLHTGDIGYMDEQEFLYVVDRKKEMIKYRNYQIAPAHIESVLITLKGMKNVCVVGVPDLVSGDLPAALIIKKSKDSIYEADVIDIMKEKFADSQQLRGGIYFLDAWPMTPSGKNVRLACKKLAIELYDSKNK